MKTLINLYKKDMAVILRNALLWVLMGTLFIMVGFVRFLLPENFSQEKIQYLYDESQEKVLEKSLKGLNNDYIEVVPSITALYEALDNDKKGLGIIFHGTLEEPDFTVVHRNQISIENESVVNAALENLVESLRETTAEGAFEINYLRKPGRVVPRRLTAIPPLLTFEVLILGFLMVAVLVFQEKNEGSLRAYRVSPGGTALYILSKNLVFITMSLVYGFSLILLTVGPSINLVPLALLMILGVGFYTLLGLIVAVFFNNISDWFFVGLGILTVNILPSISYGFPSFSPRFITLIPSYPIMYAFSELLFPTGRSIISSIQLLIAGNLLAFGLCHWLVSTRLMKEGRA
ncbi:ABC transporter permease [Alkaliphilus crotonatoxidans]